MLIKLKTGMCYLYFSIHNYIYVIYHLRQGPVFYAMCIIWAKTKNLACKNCVKFGRTVISTWTRRKKALYKCKLTVIVIIYYIAHLYYFQTILFCHLYSHIAPKWIFSLSFRKVKYTVEFQQKFLMNSVNISWEDIMLMMDLCHTSVKPYGLLVCY